MKSLVSVICILTSLSASAECLLGGRYEKDVLEKMINEQALKFQGVDGIKVVKARSRFRNPFRLKGESYSLDLDVTKGNYTFKYKGCDVDLYPQDGGSIKCGDEDIAILGVEFLYRHANCISSSKKEESGKIRPSSQRRTVERPL